MPDTHHHLCFISDQNVAELLGALMYEPGSVQIHALATPRMAEKAETFKKTCRRNGIACSIYPLSKAGIEEIGRLLDAIYKARPGGDWAVNITGGTKLMTLAAFDWATRNNIAAFYIDTASRVINFHQAGLWRKLRLPDVLKFDALLNLYGYEIEMGGAAHPISGQESAVGLIDLGSHALGLAAIHYLNDRAIAASATTGLTTPYEPAPHLAKLLAICNAAGKLNYTKSYITFPNNDCRKWCNGIWLEEYVQTVLALLQAEGRITSWASNVKIIGAGYYNELDAIFTVNNRLHVIECKTSRLASKGGATSILYKSDSLNDRIGGSFTRSLLCALDPLSEAEEQRAKNMGIKAVIGAELKNLKEILTEWIETA